MDSLSVGLASIAVLVYSSFIAGVWLVFRKVEPDPAQLVLLKASALGSAIAYVTAILFGAPSATLATVGAVFYFCALFLFLWAAIHTRSRKLSLAYSTDEPTFLLTSGPWRYVRHPFYTAYLLSYVAGTFASANPWTLGILAGMVAIYSRCAWFEERKLALANIATEWADWRENTGMFIPKLGRRQL